MRPTTKSVALAGWKTALFHACNSASVCFSMEASTPSDMVTSRESGWLGKARSSAMRSAHHPASSQSSFSSRRQRLLGYLPTSSLRVVAVCTMVRSSQSWVSRFPADP